MNIVYIFSLLAFISFSWPLRCEPLKMVVEGEAAILVNADTGAILFEKNAHSLRSPASITKVATALYLLKTKSDELDTMVSADQESLVSISQESKRKSKYTLPGYWHEPDGTHIGIKKDEELKLIDLLGGMLICSGNDAANVIAQYVGGGKIPVFMDQLNHYLKEELGCRQTHFCNPHGLYHPDHQTTAYDLSIITREALKHPVFCEIVSQTRFMRPKTNKQPATTLLQGNRLLRPGKYYYAKAIGVKTGYVAKAKHTFIAAARSQNRTLIAVLLGYKERNQMFLEAVKLFEAAFNQPKVHHVYLKAGLQKFSLPMIKAKKPLETYLAEDLSFDYYPAENPGAKCLLYWESLEFPIRENQKVGEVRLVSVDGTVLKINPLFAKEDVTLKWPHSWISGIKVLGHQHPALLWTALIAACLVVIIGIGKLLGRR